MMESLSLQELQPGDDRSVLDMLHEIGPGEQGFVNVAYPLTAEQFPAWLKAQVDMSKGIDLPPRHVPMTTLWLRRSGYPVGVSKLRHRLSEQLLINGGHIGYCIRPSERGKGYGKAILRLTLARARELGIDSALLTCADSNTRSWRCIESCGGVLEKTVDARRYYWIAT